MKLFSSGFLTLVSLHSRDCKENRLPLSSSWQVCWYCCWSIWRVVSMPPNNQCSACCPQAPPFLFPLALMCLMRGWREEGTFYEIYLSFNCPTALLPRYLFQLPTIIFSNLFWNNKPNQSRDFPSGQWLRVCVPNPGGLGSVPGQGTKIPMLQLRVHPTCHTEDSACHSEKTV